MTTRQRALRIVLPLIAAASVGLTACAGAPVVYDKFPTAISDDGLYRLRKCESSDNYGAVNANGTYHGAYQFSRTTWNGTARAHYPELVGIDPDDDVLCLMTHVLLPPVRSDVDGEVGIATTSRAVPS